MNFLSLLLAVFLITTLACASPLQEENINDCDKPNEWAPVCGQHSDTGEYKLFLNICDLRVYNIVKDSKFKETDLTICFDHINFEQFVDDLVMREPIKE